MKVKSISFVLVLISEMFRMLVLEKTVWRLDEDSQEIINGPSYCRNYIFLLTCDMEIMKYYQHASKALGFKSIEYILKPCMLIAQCHND